MVSLLPIIHPPNLEMIWLDKRAAIAQTVDELGDNFKPAIRAGWMAYIRKAYPDG